MPTPPPPLTVPCLVDDDPVNPGPQARLPAEGVDGPEHAQEHFLREVEGFVVVVQQVQRQLIHHALVLVDQLRTRVLVPRRTPLDERRLATPYVAPRNGSNRLHRQSLGHVSTRRRLPAAGAGNSL